MTAQEYLNSLRLSAAYMRRQPRTSLVQIMTGPCSAPSHYLNQCWIIVHWNLGNKLRWNFNRNLNISIQENAFENVVCDITAILAQPQCVNLACSITAQTRIMQRDWSKGPTELIGFQSYMITKLPTWDCYCTWSCWYTVQRTALRASNVKPFILGQIKHLK